MKCPQKLGTVLRVFEQAPKKPNSARRKVARVKIKSTGRHITCHLPGEGHNLTKHATVLIRGGRCQDLIGVRYKPIRGKESFGALDKRATRLSKYGVKKKTRFSEVREETKTIINTDFDTAKTDKKNVTRKLNLFILWWIIFQELQRKVGAIYYV
jgi:small subunit ribosomal protein S12